jgi:putative PIN family toxin of toxin-antitoxin system
LGFLHKLKMPAHNVDKIIECLNEFCKSGSCQPLKEKVSRDEDDDEILALASSNEIDFIIAGDKDLLVLKNYKSTQIISPRQFWEIARSKGSI